MSKFWQTFGLARKLGALRKQILLEPFSAPIGEVHSCLQFDGNTSGYLTKTILPGSLAYPLRNKFNIEFWFKSFTSFVQYPFAIKESGGSHYMIYVTLNETINVYYRKSTVTDFISSNSVFVPGVWTHVSIWYNGSALKLYINGVLQTQTANVVAPLDFAGPNYSVQIGNGIPAGNIYSGLIDEVRIFGYDRDPADILAQWKIPLGSLVSRYLNIYYKLVSYLKFNEGTGTTTVDAVDGDVIPIGTAAWNTDEEFPYRYGADRVGAMFSITLDRAFSLKFPQLNTEELNFVLAISFNDEDGVHQRYKLWESDINTANAPIYSGETISKDSVLEVWGPDGAATVDLEEDLMLETSILAEISAATDEATVLATPIVNKLIASNFTFPLTFNQPNS